MTLYFLTFYIFKLTIKIIAKLLYIILKVKTIVTKEFVDFLLTEYGNALKKGDISTPYAWFMASNDNNKMSKFSDILLNLGYTVDQILKELGIDDGYVPSEMFMECDNLKNLELFNSKGIGLRTFRNCKNLETVKINEGAEEIYDDAFLNCESLKDVYLPSTIKKIDKGAFRTQNLMAIHINMTQREWYSYVEIEDDAFIMHNTVFYFKD